MADLLDEAVLKLISLTIRLGQLAFSLAIVGCTSQFATDLSDRGLDVPQGPVASAAMSGVAALWSALAMLVTLCAGRIMLEIETTMDVICMAMSVAEAALLSQDTLSSLKEFADRYAQAIAAGFMPSRGLIRASFAIAIVNVVLFASTSLMSWVVVLIRRRHEAREKHHHHHDHDHVHHHH
ncbi:hypothetical protein QBC47DRAFT_459688 [Echria macrotheca]|uniref:Uncharacterized protein n=1 Tax=Echria macrotheca TaxID=438768 RepID=A0AAJ0BEX3_9PEZI|nr:hypothetical protein QBC47DRAFT_459688 [Echria macrotheca]